jgi:uncharacterized protein (TIGR02099 family)
MIDLHPIPSLRLKTLAGCATWAVRLLVVLWVVMGLLWAGLHFLIVPRIDSFRPWLQEQASARLGLTVRIGAMQARSNGFIPSVELSRVQLLDAQGREALQLPVVLAALSPRSLLGFGFEQLYIEAPVLDVRRSADGALWIAGLQVPHNPSADGAGADWLFSQTELAIRHGTVRWTDELRGAPPLTLTDVDVVLRNSHTRHALRLDATPPADWGGQRLTVRGIFKQPLLSHRAGLWQEWQGQLYAEFDHVDLAQLRRHVDVGVAVSRGVGSVRSWVDVDQGQVTAATADVALQDVVLSWQKNLEPVAMTHVSGRLGVQQLAGGYAFSTEALAFDTQDGLHWPGGNVRLALLGAQAPGGERGEFSADRLDLAALHDLAKRLPLGDATHAWLKDFAPSGLVDQLQGHWQGPLAAPSAYAAKGHVTQLALPAAQHQGVATPGFTGTDVSFDLTQAGGTASVEMRQGALHAPGVWDEPVMGWDQLSADIRWTVTAQRLRVDVTRAHLSNPDVQADMQLTWHTADAAGAARFPGVLDLQGSASRVLANRIARYLPTQIDAEVRHYLQDALVEGSARDVKFRVKGDLAQFPFETPRHGDMRITADVQNVTLAFAPAFLLPKDSLPWPQLTQLSGELVIDRNVLQARGVKGGVSSAPNVQITKADAQIDHLFGGSVVTVNAESKGPVNEVLGTIATSPLALMTGHALQHASGTGVADYRLKLVVPVLDVDKTTVQGAVTLAGNDVAISPDIPRLQRARGGLTFTENGFALTAVQARALGGDVRLDGGLAFGPVAGTARVPVLRIQGSASADGLRQAKELGFVARLAQYANGTAAYTATVGLRGGVPELQVNTALTGMALSLPAPFAKTAEASLPVRLETQALPSAAAPGTFTQDQLKLDVGNLATATYVRDVSGPQTRVLRGAIGVGLAADESAPVPAEGVVANLNMGSVDLDAWSKVVGNATGTDLSLANANPASDPALAYLPTVLAVRAKELLLGGRKINQVVVGGGREGLLWRANLDANELSGYMEYRQPTGSNAGRVYARLARLVIGPSTAQDMESLLDEQPASIPALDIVVEDMELRGKKLGRVDVDAINLGGSAARDGVREWRLNRFNITTPEAVLTASGNWTNINAQAGAAPARSLKERRRTVLNFKLDITDSGELLTRFGMPGVVRKGQGKIEGLVSWLGSPLSLDYPSLGGKFNVNVENGQFLKADPGLAKLLGVLSLQSLPRRLALDFRDVFSEGFAFDFVRGDVDIDKGMAKTNNLQMKGVNAVVGMEGEADIAKETQNLRVIVVPEINAGSLSVLTSAVNPLAGIVTFLAQVILRRPLIDANTQEFLITGTWVDPRVTKVDRKAAPPPAPASSAPVAKP